MERPSHVPQGWRHDVLARAAVLKLRGDPLLLLPVEGTLPGARVGSLKGYRANN
jgi:hypothetical protein